MSLDATQRIADVYQTRLKNLRLVINTSFNGVDARLARALGVAPTVVSRYFTSPDLPHYRPIGAKMARRIEQAVHEPSGWMDHEHSPSDEITEQRLITEARRLIRELGPVAAKLWGLGDGKGGWLIEELRVAVSANGAAMLDTNPQGKTRKTLSRSIRERVIARDGLTCAYCRSVLDPEDVTIDHVVPVVRGGTDELTNLAISCRPCNSKKGTKDAVPHETAKGEGE